MRTAGRYLTIESLFDVQLANSRLGPNSLTGLYLALENDAKATHMKPPGPFNLTIRVNTRSGNSTQVRMAIGHGQTLELVDTETPCERAFTASQYTVLIALTDRSETIQAELWSDEFGEMRKVGSFGGGTCGRFVRHNKPVASVLSLAGGGLA